METLKKITKYSLPVFYGLLIYLTIRAITDSADMNNHFSVGWVVLVIEISGSILIGYLYTWLIKYFSKNTYFTRDKLFNPKSVLKEFALFCFYVMIITNSTMIVLVAVTDDGLSWHDFIIVNLIPLLYNLIIISVIRGNYYIKEYINNKLQLERLARDKAEEELKFLKGQYQPHFLFNALNTIYFQMDESIEGAKSSVEKLSELLRYRLYDDDSAKVLLAKEIEYLKKYIQFQTIRSSEHLKINTEIDVPVNGETVYPFLFLPLVENAFKYVSGEMWIKIQLCLKDNKLEFNVNNSIDNELFTNYKNGGIGLQNLEKRLKLLYENNFELETTVNENHFSASLNINLE